MATGLSGTTLCRLRQAGADLFAPETYERLRDPSRPGRRPPPDAAVMRDPAGVAVALRAMRDALKLKPIA